LRNDRGADNHPEAQTGARQDRVCGDIETEMLVDGHVLWGEREQMAAYAFRISSGCHLSHERAAKSHPLMAKFDAEPVEVPICLQSWHACQVGGKLLETGKRFGTPRGSDLPSASRIAILLK
jgi:hypothetical protein